MVLFLHNRYRTTGGEERAVEDLMWLVREQLGEEAELLARDSAQLGRARAAVGLIRGGLAADDVAAAVRRTGARVVHAHNVNPSLGWRALAAAREAGARVVLSLHNFRLVCAVGTCFTRGADCTRCHGRNTLPGVRLNCRGTGPEAIVYGASLALWQRRLIGMVDAFVVPSVFARQRLAQLGAALPSERVHVVGHPVREFATRSRAEQGTHALVSGRLAPEKGVEVAIDACRETGIPLVVAGDGPRRAALQAHARGADVRFPGQLGEDDLAGLRRESAIAVVPSRSAETFSLAAAEAMAAGVPVAASAVGALPELVAAEGLVPPGDARALARGLAARRHDQAAGQRAIEQARRVAAPEVVAPALAAAYLTTRG
jgi:glycosyltransferase involved in cell wall biosynthesis